MIDIPWKSVKLATGRIPRHYTIAPPTSNDKPPSMRVSFSVDLKAVSWITSLLVFEVFLQP